MKRILIVEDNEFVRYEIRDCLKNGPGYEFFEAADGDEGYSILAENPEKFDLVILDYNLPGMNGMDLLRTLARERKAVSGPIIMITAESEAKGTEVKDLNITSWIVKPISKPRLEQLVVQIFSLDLRKANKWR